MLKCPALMPHELDYCQESESPLDLFERLQKKPVDMIAFLESACADHTWTEEFSETVQEMLTWLTRRYYDEKLSLDYAKRLILVIQEHYTFLRPLLFFQNAIYYNTTFFVEGKPFLINGLLFGVCSDHFRLLIKKTWNAQKNEVKLEKISAEIFSLIEEFVNTGSIAFLWRREYSEIESLMRQATSWELTELVTLCSHTLKRYLNKDNVVSTLIQAQKEGFLEWKREACDFINGLDKGAKLQAPSAKTLSFEFQTFKGVSMELFDQLCPYITHLVFAGSMSESAGFSEVIPRCPKLIGIDLSGSKSYHERLSDLPVHLKELDLTSCGWLDDSSFEKIIGTCPNLQKLILVFDVHLSYVGWSKLNLLNSLRYIDLTRCHQIDDAVIKMISQSAPGLETVFLGGCSKVTDDGIMEATRWWKHLTKLDLSDCTEIGDRALSEIARLCYELIDIRIARCDSLTMKGIVEIIRYRPGIRYIDLTGCYIPEEAVTEWRNMRPLSKIVF